jgi:hypothetical protein
VFSPNGQEVLLSYSGEHVYLMDAICGQEDPVVYRARDLPKRMMLTPTANGAESMTLPLSSGTVGYSHRHNFAWVMPSSKGFCMIFFVYKTSTLKFKLAAACV